MSLLCAEVKLNTDTLRLSRASSYIRWLNGEKQTRFKNHSVLGIKELNDSDTRLLHLTT